MNRPVVKDWKVMKIHFFNPEPSSSALRPALKETGFRGISKPGVYLFHHLNDLQIRRRADLPVVNIRVEESIPLCFRDAQK